MQSYFRNTPRGQAYIYKLCNEDDAREQVDVPMVPLKNPVAKMEKIPLWAHITKFINLITP